MSIHAPTLRSVIPPRLRHAEPPLAEQARVLAYDLLEVEEMA
jgi:hypothetical protein